MASSAAWGVPVPVAAMCLPALASLIGVGSFALPLPLFFLGCGGGAKTASASERKSHSFSRGMPTCPERARRSAKRVSLSSAVASMAESRTSSASRRSFSSAMPSARVGSGEGVGVEVDDGPEQDA